MDPTAEERFTRIYEAHYLAVLAYCARRVNRSEAEDAVNETFTVLWKKIDSIDPAHPLPWLYRVAYGAVQNRRRGARRRQSLRAKLSHIGHAPVDGADVVVVQNDEDRAVLEAVGRLRDKDQEVLRLSIWEELPAADIAAVLDCSTAAAEQRLHRAKRRLAQKLSSSSIPRSVPSNVSLENGGTS